VAFLRGWMVVVIACALSAPSPALAGNGLNDGATGVQSAGMANADLVLTNNTAAININPAGLSHVEDRHLDVLFEPVLWSVDHKDPIGGERSPDNHTVFVFGGGYARRLNEKWVAGVGMFFQGGAGFEYKDLPNAFGPPDDVIGLFGSLKIAPGMSWQVNDCLTLGAALGLLYSTAEQKIFPNISGPAFEGFRIDELAGVSTNVRLGMLYRLSPRWTLGATYTSKAPIRLRNGRMRINRSGRGLAPLEYDDVSQKGLNFAQELAVGLAFEPTDRWKIAMDVAWADWSSAMKATRLTARDPDDPSAPSVLDIRSPLAWRNQTMIAFGVEYRWSRDTWLRTGVSFARSPQPASNVSPIFNLIAERTYGAGIVHRLGERWELSVSGVIQPDRNERYVNPLYGGEARETFGAYAGYVGLARRW
jgi:long-chain fatty acid transport protein